jgi:hypothetical protein
MRVRAQRCTRTYLVEAIDDAGLHAKEERGPTVIVIGVGLLVL